MSEEESIMFPYCNSMHDSALNPIACSVCVCLCMACRHISAIL